MLRMLSSRDSSFLPFQGSCPHRSSQKITPSDQISHFRVYSILCKTCGAMQQGVPTCERSRSSQLATNLAIPKSANLALPLLSKMLAGFRSRCTIPCRRSSSHPATTCLNTSTLLASPHGPCSVNPLRSSSQRSITMYTAPFSSSTSYTLTMLAWLSCVKMRTSLARRAVMDWRDFVSPDEGIFISLMAQSPSSKTLPKLPAAMTLPNWYLPFPIEVITLLALLNYIIQPKKSFTSPCQPIPDHPLNTPYFPLYLSIFYDDDSDYGVSQIIASANFKVTHSQCSLIDQRKILDIPIDILIDLLIHLLQHLPQVMDQEVAGLQITLDQGRRFPRSGERYWFIRENWYLGMMRDMVGLRTVRISLIPNIIKQYNSGDQSLRRGKGWRIQGVVRPTEKVLGAGMALLKAERNQERDVLSQRKYSQQILQLLRNYRICEPQCLRYSQTCVRFNLESLPRRRCYSQRVRVSWVQRFVDLCWVLALDLGQTLLSSMKQVMRSSLWSYYSQRILSSIFVSLVAVLGLEVQLSTLLLNLTQMDSLIFLCRVSKFVKKSSRMFVTSLSILARSSVFLMMIQELNNCLFAYILFLKSYRSLRHDFASTLRWF